jgi:hypothetical protein
VVVVGVVAVPGPVVAVPGPVVSVGVSPTIVLQAVRARAHRNERMTWFIGGWEPCAGYRRMVSISA